MNQHETAKYYAWPNSEYTVLLKTEHQDKDFVCAINSASSLKKVIGDTGQNVTKTKCVLADRRSTSLRQQADQLTPENCSLRHYNPPLPGFWQNIENNDRAVERFIGKLKIIVNALIRGSRSN